MTPSKCNITVKKARFYAFLLIHTLYQVEDSKISIYVQVSSPIACFFSTIQLSIFHRVFIHKNEMLSPWTKVSPLDFQHFNHFKYSKIWKERAFIEKVNSRWFCCFPAAILLDMRLWLWSFPVYFLVLCLLYDSKSDLLDCKKLYLLVILLLLFSMTHGAHANRQLQRFVSSISLYFVTFYEFRYVSFYVIEKGFCYRWRAILVVPVFNLTYLCLLTDA